MRLYHSRTHLLLSHQPMLTRTLRNIFTPTHTTLTITYPRTERIWLDNYPRVHLLIDYNPPIKLLIIYTLPDH